MPNIYIRKVPAWITKTGLVPDTMCFAIMPYIFLGKDLYEDYMTDSPTYSTKAIIAHELVHTRHQLAMGLWKFELLYLFTKKFCLNEELEATKEEMKVYKSHNATFDTERRARSLSTFWIYRLCHRRIKYDDAKKLLDALWQQT